MHPETIEHLARVEAVLREARSILARFAYPGDLRTTMVMGFVSQMFEHHEAMMLLCRAGKFGSAFALGRSIFESLYRGLWINFCANEEQIAAFDRDDRFPVNMSVMAEQIDTVYRAHGFFQNFKERAWSALCSYTHTGLLQLGRRFDGHQAVPAYDDAEIYEITTSSTTCVLLLAGKFLARQGHSEECLAVEGLTETYGPVLVNHEMAE